MLKHVPMWEALVRWTIRNAWLRMFRASTTEFGFSGMIYRQTTPSQLPNRIQGLQFPLGNRLFDVAVQ